MHLAVVTLSALASVPQDAAPITTRNVAIVIYPGVELLDFAGPGEVFAAVHYVDGVPPFRVYTVSASTEPIVSQGFVRITPEFSYANCPKPAVIVVPGGSVPDGDLELRRFLQAGAETGELVMSVCNGALALGAAGLLDGLEVTTHHGSLESLQLMVPTAKVYSNRRFVDHGRVLTSAGVSAGIDGALQVVSRMLGEQTARDTARYMEYAWRPEELAELHAQPGAQVGSATVRTLLETLRDKGQDAALALYRAEQAAGQDVPDAARWNRIGYGVLETRPAEGRAVFELAIVLNPTSANLHDSLADACEFGGDGAGAVAASRRALALLESDAALSADFRSRVKAACTARIARIETGVGAGDYACPPCSLPCDAVRHASPGDCPGCGMQLRRVTPVKQ